MITEQEARELAAHWISPSPLDRELTRFASGHDRNPGSNVDWPEFREELDYNLRNYAATDDARDELSALDEYARAQIDGA